MTILGKRHSQSKPSDGLNEILTALMAKSVQGLYSAFGRETHGQKKNKFIDTEVYKELECKFLFNNKITTWHNPNYFQMCHVAKMYNI